MSNEIELKFLVKGKKWKQGHKGKEIKQGFISSHSQRVVRIRIYGEKAYLTIKGERKGDSNPEFEWEIPKEQGKKMFATPKLVEGYIIHKKRYVIEDENIKWSGKPLKWEVDDFLDENAPLQIAEMELPGDLSTPEIRKLKGIILANLPDWVGDRLDFTKDPEVSRYFNSNLSRYPFSHWNESEKKAMLAHL